MGSNASQFEESTCITLSDTEAGYAGLDAAAVSIKSALEAMAGLQLAINSAPISVTSCGASSTLYDRVVKFTIAFGGAYLQEAPNAGVLSTAIGGCSASATPLAASITQTSRAVGLIGGCSPGLLGPEYKAVGTIGTNAVRLVDGTVAMILEDVRAGDIVYGQAIALSSGESETGSMTLDESRSGLKSHAVRSMDEIESVDGPFTSVGVLVCGNPDVPASVHAKLDNDGELNLSIENPSGSQGARGTFGLLPSAYTATISSVGSRRREIQTVDIRPDTAAITAANMSLSGQYALSLDGVHSTRCLNWNSEVAAVSHALESLTGVSLPVVSPRELRHGDVSGHTGFSFNVTFEADTFQLSSNIGNREEL